MDKILSTVSTACVACNLSTLEAAVRGSKAEEFKVVILVYVVSSRSAVDT